MKNLTFIILMTIALGFLYPQSALAQDNQEALEVPEQTITIEESRRFVEVTPVPVLINADPEIGDSDNYNLVLILSSTAVAISIISVITNLIILKASRSKKHVVPVAQEV